MYWMAYCITCMVVSVISYVSTINNYNWINYGDHKKGTALNRERNKILSQIPEDHKGWFILFYADAVEKRFQLITVLIWVIGFFCLGYVHYTGQKTESIWPLYGKIILFGSIAVIVFLLFIKLNYDKKIVEYVEFIKENEDCVGTYDIDDKRIMKIYVRLKIYDWIPLEKYKKLLPEFQALAKSEFKFEIKNPELEEMVSTFRVVQIASFYYALLDHKNELNDKEIKLISYPATLGTLDAFFTIPTAMAMLGLVVFVISWIIKLF